MRTYEDNLIRSVCSRFDNLEIGDDGKPFTVQAAILKHLDYLLAIDTHAKELILWLMEGGYMSRVNLLDKGSNRHIDTNGQIYRGQIFSETAWMGLAHDATLQLLRSSRFAATASRMHETENRRRAQYRLAIKA